MPLWDNWAFAIQRAKQLRRDIRRELLHLLKLLLCQHVLPIAVHRFNGPIPIVDFAAQLVGTAAARGL